MAKILIGMGEYAVSDQPGDQLIIHSLGSCLGVCVYAHDQGIAGMAHFVLPLARDGERPDAEKPCQYVDSGLHLFFSQLVRRGMELTHCHISVSGGASMWDKQCLFDIGNRNYIIFRRFMWKNKLLIDGEDVGGSIPRSMRLQIGDKAVSVQSRGEERVLKGMNTQSDGSAK